jgi:hypothetical protein
MAKQQLRPDFDILSNSGLFSVKLKYCQFFI